MPEQHAVRVFVTYTMVSILLLSLVRWFQYCCYHWYHLYSDCYEILNSKLHVRGDFRASVLVASTVNDAKPSELLQGLCRVRARGFRVVGFRVLGLGFRVLRFLRF